MLLLVIYIAMDGNNQEEDNFAIINREHATKFLYMIIFKENPT